MEAVQGLYGKRGSASCLTVELLIGMVPKMDTEVVVLLSLDSGSRNNPGEDA